MESASRWHLRDPSERLQLVGQIARGLESPPGILLEAVTHELLESRVDVLVRGPEIRRILLEYRGHGLGGRTSLERAMAPEHLVHDDAKREDVAPAVDGRGLDLLGGHVADRSHHDARLGRRRKLGLACGALDLGELGQAEIEDLDAAPTRHEEILGLQVPMDDSFVMRGCQALGDLRGVADRLPRRDWPLAKLLAQRLPFEQFFDDVWHAVVLPHVVDDRDVGMVEDPRGAGFLLETPQPIRVRGYGSREDL